MKKLLQLTLVLVFLSSSYSFSLAQTNNDLNTTGDTETTELENEKTSAPKQEETPGTENKEEQKTLQEQITAPQQSFWEILAAILIPSLFIILVYFILKTFKF